VKEHFSYIDIKAIVVSDLTDCIVVVRLPAEGAEARGDLILQVDYVVEFVIKLATYANKVSVVQIESSGK